MSETLTVDMAIELDRQEALRFMDGNPNDLMWALSLRGTRSESPDLTPVGVLVRHVNQELAEGWRPRMRQLQTLDTACTLLRLDEPTVEEMVRMELLPAIEDDGERKTTDGAVHFWQRRCADGARIRELIQGDFTSAAKRRS